MTRFRPLHLALALALFAAPALAGSGSGQSSGGQSSGGGQGQGQMQMGNGQMQMGNQMQNGGQTQGRQMQNGGQETKPSFKVTVQHDRGRKTIANSGARGARPVRPVDPTAKPVRTMEEMGAHNRAAEACLAYCTISQKNWLAECVAKAGPEYPCGSLGDSWYYQCQHGCVNGK